MIIRSVFLTAVLAGLVLASQAAEACRYLTPYENLSSQIKATYARLSAISEQYVCGSEWRSIVNELIPMHEQRIDILTQASADEECVVDNTGSDNKSLASLREALAICGSSEPDKGGRVTCVTPPPPAAPVRTDPWNMCMTGTNTNTHESCRYSFSYRKGDDQESSTILGPQESEEACSSEQDVDIVFEKWTRSGSGAQ